MSSVLHHLPPTSVTLAIVTDLEVPAFLIRRGRRTLLVARAGLTRRQIRQHLRGVLRPAELAVVRRSLGEKTSGPLPPYLDQQVLEEGEPIVFRPTDIPRPLTTRLA